MRLPACSTTVLFVFSSLLFAASGAYAQTTWHVDDDACPAPGSGSQADPFCSIQAAIDIATDGDEVVVRAGTYLENINYLGKSITVRSIDPEDPDTVASTVIDGSGANEEDTFGSVVTFINGPASGQVLNGLTLFGGIGTKVFDERCGGAVYVTVASPTIRNCLLNNNRARSGGGLYCIGEGADPVISNCTIRSNVAHRGGGIACGAHSSPWITRCWILGNRSVNGGGALSSAGGSPTISNCIIAGNVSAWGGALSLTSQGTTTVRNSTIVANEASVRGGAIFLNGDGATLRNCISWGNTAPEGLEFSLVSGVLSADFCDVQGGQEGVEVLNNSTLLWGAGNIDEDPLFLGTQPMNEHLSAESPCVNAGDPLFIPGSGEEDIDGDERVINLIVDMGADEFNPDCNGNEIPDEEDITNGTSMDCNNNGVPDECLNLEIDCNENALPDECDIELGDSDDGDGNGVPDECEPKVTIYVDDDATGQPVQDGTVDDPFGTIGQGLDAVLIGQARVEVVVADGVYLGEGNKNLDFEGKILTLRSANGPESTIIDCQGAGRGFSFISGETRDAILDGFTIKNGRARNGGAITCLENSNPTIRNCILIDNISDQLGKGGGLYASSSSPLITHCSIVGNIAESTGRGGGGFFFVGNVSNLQPAIENSLIVDNAAHQGGGIWTTSDLAVRNCTIARNNAANQGGGIHNQGFAHITVSNCVLWDNTAMMGSEIYLRTDNASLTVKYSDVQGGQAGVEGAGIPIWETGNIDADPLFVVADQGDYHLLPGSPAIDAGDSTAVPPDVSDLDGDGDTSEPIPFDLDGRPRFLAELDTPDTGNPDGIHAIVDMGPYELGQPGCPDLDDDGRVTICHAPPGNPDNTHTMTVNANMATVHLAHGDTCGPCGGFPCVPTSPPDVPDGQIVWYVDDDSCPESGSGSQADPFCKIQDGIIASDHGDVVLVAPGTYFERIGFLGKSIIVQSYEPTNPEVIGCTLIDGSQAEPNESGPIVTFASGEGPDSVLRGLTVQNGYTGTGGAGIRCGSGSSPTISNCVIRNNLSEAGGAIACVAGSPTIMNCTITQNTAISGGAVSVGTDSSPVINGCLITNNTASYRGGGIATFGNSTVTDCVFASNTTVVAEAHGAAIYNGGGGSLVVSGCVFSNNSTNAYGRGGGIYNDIDSEVTVSNCLFRDNMASWGGGIQSFHASGMTLSNCTFRQNTASDGSGGGVVSEWTDLVATNCVFEGNVAADSDGGAQQGGAPGRGNRPGRIEPRRQPAAATIGYGGGLSVVGASASVTNCLFDGNSGLRGGAVSCISDSSLSLAHCTIRGNHADATGGGVLIAGDADVIVDNCILWNDTAPEGPEILIYAGPGTLTVGYSDIEGGEEGIEGGGAVVWGDGNIDADPLFVDADGTDYRLPSGSPCVDAGDNTAVPPDTGDLDNDGDTDEPVPVDLDGAPRFANDLDTPDTGNPDGIRPIVDMGAYELEGSECADDDGDGQVTICHQPPGNSGNPQTMSVNQNNLPAHLAHGDSCGPCEEGGEAPPDPGGDGESEASACPADLDGDGAVGAADLTELLAAWGACAGCPADFDGDGQVGPTDLGGVLSAWGMCP